MEVANTYDSSDVKSCRGLPYSTVYVIISIYSLRQYAFGLGKRDPYAFGLGKRDPYAFGLGKRDPYAFGLGKRDPYSFGLGR